MQRGCERLIKCTKEVTAYIVKASHISLLEATFKLSIAQHET